MADTKVKRSTLTAQPKRRRLDRRLKNRLYESVYDLNRDLTSFWKSLNVSKDKHFSGATTSGHSAT
jgi:hypothetical protein